MKIILMENIPKLGESGKIIEVKDGYARNYLIPKGLALPATPGSLRMFEQIKKQRLSAEEKRKQKLRELAEQIEGMSIDILVRVDEEDRLFGSVTPQMVVDAFKEKGIDIDRKWVIIEEPIQSLGVYSIKIKPSDDLESNVRLWVVKA